MESLDSVRWLNFDIRLVRPLLHFPLLLEEESLLSLGLEELLLILGLLASSDLLVFQTQSKTCGVSAALNLSPTPLYMAQLRFTDVR